MLLFNIKKRQKVNLSLFFLQLFIKPFLLLNEIYSGLKLGGFTNLLKTRKKSSFGSFSEQQRHRFKSVKRTLESEIQSVS